MTSALRYGEFTTRSSRFVVMTDLSLNDIQVDKRINPSVVLINIKVSKTHQFRQDHTIRLGDRHLRSESPHARAAIFLNVVVPRTTLCAP